MIDYSEELVINGKAYCFAPINLKTLKKMKQEESKYESQEFPLVQLICDLAFQSLKRNYPDITLEEMEEMVDPRNASVIHDHIMKVAGYKAKDSTEEVTEAKN